MSLMSNTLLNPLRVWRRRDTETQIYKKNLQHANTSLMTATKKKKAFITFRYFILDRCATFSENGKEKITRDNEGDLYGDNYI